MKRVYAGRPNRTGSVKVFHITVLDLSIMIKESADPVHAKPDSSEYRNINAKLEG